MSSFFLPCGSPLHDRIHQFMHAADGVHLFTAFAECRVHINASARNTHPHRTEVLQHDVHICRLAENTHVRQHPTIDEIVRAAAVPPIFLPFTPPPLRFLT